MNDIKFRILLQSNKTGSLKSMPCINGKEVDLDLLYQIVTSHGGWEKVNARNEWDDLLEHFNLPRGLNGGLLIKHIYLKYLENYEKVFFMGEDANNKDDAEDDYDDIRSRRRTANKFTSGTRSQHQTPNVNQSSSQSHPVPLSDAVREQMGLAKPTSSLDYERLLLSLQSPLPNDQDLAISVCTLLSNETKHVLKFSKCPAILNMLLAHAGIYEHCGMRMLIEETYKDARGLCLSEFWEDILYHKESMPLLCESYVRKIQSSLGLAEEDELDQGEKEREKILRDNKAMEALLEKLMDPNEEFTSEAPSPVVPSSNSDLLSTAPSFETSVVPPDCVLSANVPSSDTTSVVNNSEAADEPMITDEEVRSVDPIATNCALDIDEDAVLPEPPPVTNNSPYALLPSVKVTRSDLPFKFEATGCCLNCPCHKSGTESSLADENPPKESDSGEITPYPFHLRRSAFSDDKVGQRVQQISHILRNLSFESDNASIMGSNSTLLRYLLITANCSWGSLPQMSYDLLGNIAPYVKLEDPAKDPLSSMLLSLVSTGMFSADRFKVLRSLEILRELTKIPRNEKIIVNYMENKVYRRMCELLTICDIMLLICTLECVLAMTGLGEAVCNELVRVKGSVSTLVSLVTVEAQSYGPKGCILMRVVETVSGGSSQGVVHQQPTAQPAQSPSASITPLTSVTPQSSPSVASVVSQNITSPVSVSPAVALRTVTGQTVVPPPSQPMQQQLTQPISNVYSPPSSNPVMTVAAPNVLNRNSSLQQQHLGAVLRPTTPSAAPTACVKVVSVNNTTQLRIQQPQQNIPRPNDASHRSPPVLVAGQNLGKSGLPNVLVNHVNNIPSDGTSTNSALNNVNHLFVGSNIISGVGATSTTNSGGLAQVSSQSLTQQLYTPSTNLVTPPKEAEGGEEGWLTSWLRNGFESGTTSIEQEKCYLMYCGIRNDKSAVLPMDKFLQIVKNVFGASVGPVMKTFGGVSLHFLNGISPKITQAPQGISQPIGISVPVSDGANSSGTGTMQQDILHSDAVFVPVSNGVSIANHQPNSPSTVAPVRPSTPNQGSVHIPSPMSPILKATLSRPPTPKSPPDEKRGKCTKGKDKRQSINDKNPIVAKKKLSKNNPPVQTFRKQQAQTKVLSPSSSAIRSLLASKVAQRQQNKLQQQETKSPKAKNNSVGVGAAEKGKKSPKGKHKKMNGAVNSPSDKEESSASSSLNSSEDSESKNDHSSLSFQGVLSNGVASDESLQATDILEDSGKNSNIKGMLVDLLERKVTPKDVVNVNGVVGREIRISDRGLELIEKEDSNSASGATIFNNSLGLTESQEPQQMTFYASTPEVEQPVQTAVDPVPDPNQPIFYASEESRGSNDSSQFGVTKNPATLNNQVKKQNSVEDQGLIVDSGAAGGGLFFDGNGNSSVVTGDVMINNNSNYVGGGGGGSNNNIGAANNAAGDLLEKFNQFSDLIVVNPEQLGIKRPSTHEEGEADACNDQSPPPAKKPAIAVNGNDSVPVTSSALGYPVISTFTIHPSNNPAISTAAPSQVALVSSPSPVLQTALSSTGTATTTSQKIITEYPLNVVQNQIMQLPIKLTIDRTNPNVLSFTGGKLVMRPGGTPLIFAPSQLPSNPVIYSKNASSNEIPKIYLVQPNQTQQSGLPQQMTMAVVHESPNHPPGAGPGIVNLATLVPRPDGVPPNSYSHVPPEEIENEIPFLCEWGSCGYRFSKPQFVFMHCVKHHIPDSLDASLPCKWGTGCDPLARKRFCLMTHLQDRHCNSKMLEHANYRRKNNLEAPPLPQHPPNHPMYAPNAAYHAIKRHALQYSNPKDLLDENEGPVTKSIRLTSALILRNLVNYSHLGRRIVGSYESHLSTVAMSNVESSRTIAQLLHDMSEDRHQPSHSSS